MRRVLFLASAATLVGLLGLLLADHRATPPAPAGSPARVASPAPVLTLEPPRAPARPAARRFLAAYLAYEAGAPRAAAEIRAYATALLAREILASHPPPVRADTGHLQIAGLTVAKLPDRPDLTIVTGTARRASGPEPLAFLFARRAGLWLAVAPAE